MSNSDVPSNSFLKKLFEEMPTKSPGFDPAILPPEREEVFVLWNNEPYDMSEILGIYATRQAAEEAQARLRYPGLYQVDVFPIQ